MMTRRRFLHTSLLLAGGLMTPSVRAALMTMPADAWFMPDEAEPHARTWMAFGASKRVWGRRLLPEVQRNLATIARTIARYEPVTLLVRKDEYELAHKLTDAMVDLVLEGCGIEVDGHGTAIITESCVLNPNRNPGLTKAGAEQELKRLLGLKKIIWLPGIRGKDITDGHTDFYARFARPGVVVAGYDADPESFDHAVTQRHLELLKSATDVQGRKLEAVVIEGPSSVRKAYETEEFAAGYINFYVCNGAVIAPEFGDRRADQIAREKLQALFPGRDVVQLNIDGIAAGGGGIHCTTQQEPKVS